jgi:hypothetical protein
LEKYFYQTYGLSIASDFKIDAFQEVGEFENDSDVVQLEKSTINFEGYTFIDDFVIREYTEQGFLYVIKNVVAFLITENRMQIFPLIENSKIWQSFLVGGAMAIVLIQKGYFLLHGSAIENKNSAYLFLGLSGVGKSSLATGLGEKGDSIITDDICTLSRIDEDLYISLGTKQVRLLKDAVEALEVKNVTALDHPTTKPKYGYNFDRKLDDSKIKVEKIIELVVDESMEEEIMVEKIVSFESIELLKANVYKQDLARTLKADSQNFQFMMISANTIECLRIKRRDSDYDLNTLVDFVKENIIDCD